MAFDEDWVPKTRLGKLVVEGQVASMDEAIKSGLPIREPQIIDMLLPDLEDEVLDINMVQRMTDSGRRVKFRATVIVGNRNGYVGSDRQKTYRSGLLSARQSTLQSSILPISAEAAVPGNAPADCRTLCLTRSQERQAV